MHRAYRAGVPASPTVRPVEAGELDAVVALIAAEQARPERLITYVGTEPTGIRAELDGLEPPWAETLRVVGDDSGDDDVALVGVTVVEWDEELGRAWILGPWVAGDDDAWTAHADGLLDAALEQPPSSITEHEVSGAVANVRLGALAAARGWTASVVNHALIADASVVAGWPATESDADEPAALRAAVAGDTAAIAPLHDAEFPGTYASAPQLVAGQADGSRVVLVAPAAADEAAADTDAIAGYAAGQVHDDGEGFIDFVAVDLAARGTGVGRRLVMALTRDLLARSTMGRVALTVQDGRAPARALYEQLGFRPDGSFVAYRSPAPS